MTLRTRLLIASAVGLVALLAMGLMLFVQYSVTSAVGAAVHSELSPAADATAALTLAQSDASGALSDYIMLNRPESLDAYRQSLGRASTLMEDIAQSIPDGYPDITDLLAQARDTQRTWVRSDGDPVIALMEAGKRKQAMKATNSAAAWESYDAMTAASTALSGAVNDARDQAAGLVVAFTTILGISLLVVGVLVVAGLGLIVLGLQGWVIGPLRQLQDDLQQAARGTGHESPIRGVGPPELRAVSVDAELLRRGLVRELDDARAAREGLAQDAPLVKAMQGEMTARPPVGVPGLDIAGLSQSAEGVMAGDWWDAVPRPDGSLALVVADVSGHGPDASVTAVRVRSIVRAGLQAGLDPERVVAMAAESCAEDSHFVTGIFLVVDTSNDTLRWCNAGHHPAIVVTRDKESYLCEPTGPLISSLGGEWTTSTEAFRGGDVLVAFTDGLVESRNADGDELESSKVSLLIRGMDAPVRESPDELISQLLAQVRHRAADWRRDDVTLVAASRRR